MKKILQIEPVAENFWRVTTKSDADLFICVVQAPTLKDAWTEALKSL